MSQAESIKAFILAEIVNHPTDIVAYTSAHFNVTRTTIHRHLKGLLAEHKVIKSGSTRSTRYHLVTSLDRELSYKIIPGLSEFNVYTSDIEGAIKEFSENVQDIIYYGFTEIFNNAIDHSQGSLIKVLFTVNNECAQLTILDDGIGIFKSIANYFSLDDLRESVLQLNKGKMTTDPANHSGEGIFFTSRAFDSLEIYANNLHYIRDNIEEDWSLGTASKRKHGSKVVMTINVNATLDLTDVFKKYQDDDSLAFCKTDIVVALAKYEEEKLMSRSQAKRITRELEKFTNVTLDFKDIKLVGQGFVDEIFRVYVNKHPQLTFTYINASEDVEFMIRRGIATAKQSSP